MNRRLLAYLLLAAWASWLSAALGLAGSFAARGAFLPDPVLCLVVLIAATLPRREAFPAALTLALARIAFTVDAPTAILASYLGAALFVRAARRGVEVHGPLSRGLLCLAIVWCDGIWLSAVRAQRAVFAGHGSAGLLGSEGLGGLGQAAAYALPRALASGLLAMVFGRMLLRLPGIGLLDRRRAF